MDCFQAELEKGIKEGRARVKELQQRVQIVEAEGGDVEGEDPVSGFLQPVVAFCFSLLAFLRWKSLIHEILLSIPYIAFAYGFCLSNSLPRGSLRAINTSDGAQRNIMRNGLVLW